ncbi:hypothetical protein [Trinickia sp. Y13]|uniref:hypothetical protein n=1 Tax=Trinickia sp. Y13 TaxID=2917807 RepID=UPI0024059476|nr:hypothetical protein [Trinickia sp. Y13]MDG0023701.1 hypothetical protein [Trinickia sp. Y13]
MTRSSQCSAPHRLRAGHSAWLRSLGLASAALALGACAQQGLDNVKPTATTAYHSSQPSAPPAPAAESAPPQ